MILALLWACAEPRVTLVGTVRDPWGGPVEGATVRVARGADGATSGADGAFSLALPSSDAVMLDASKPGHAGQQLPGAAGVAFTLWPIPERPGFHAVGHDAYTHLPGRSVVTRDGAAGIAQPVASPFAAPVPALTGDARFVFLSTTRATQLDDLALSLSRMETRGAVDVPVAEVPIGVEPLGARDLYLVRPSDTLAPGRYAFHASGAFDVGAAMTPDEQRLTHPFEVR